MQIGARRARPVRLSVSTGIGHLFTVANTLAGSTLLSVRVKGEPAIYAALYPRLSAVKTQILADRDRRIALTARVVVLEGGTPSTLATPTPSSDPTYDPAATVVVNAQRFSDFLDAVIALAANERVARAMLRSRINALKSPPANTLTYQGQILTRQGLPLTYGASA